VTISIATENFHPHLSFFDIGCTILFSAAILDFELPSFSVKSPGMMDAYHAEADCCAGITVKTEWLLNYSLI